MNQLMLLLLILTVLVSAVYVVRTQHEARAVFMEVQQLKKVRDQLNEEWGRLQLEQSTWAGDDRIGRMAKEELNMFEPDNGLLIFLIP